MVIDEIANFDVVGGAWLGTARDAGLRIPAVKVIRVVVSQKFVHERTTFWMTSKRPGKLSDFALQPHKSNPRRVTCFQLSG